MFKLCTGVVGSGKTAFAIDEVLGIVEKADFKRPVYYNHIGGVEIEGWTELSDAELQSWADLPVGSILIIDEAHEVMPARAQSVMLPEWVRKLSEVRHSGIDVFVITQNAKMIDVHVRRLFNVHVHTQRVRSSKLVRRWEWDSCSESHDKQSERKKALSTERMLPKRVFGLYESAPLHTEKLRVPYKIVIGVVVLCMLSLMVVYLLFGLLGSGVLPDAVAESGSGLHEGWRKVELTHLEKQVPRIDGVPYTAPIYDDLTEPKSYPRPQCFHPTERPNLCKCYTQQASLMVGFPVNLCVDIVENGRFDSAAPEVDTRGKIRVATAGAGGARAGLLPRRVNIPAQTKPSTNKIIIRVKPEQRLGRAWHREEPS